MDVDHRDTNLKDPTKNQIGSSSQPGQKQSFEWILNETHLLILEHFLERQEEFETHRGETDAGSSHSEELVSIRTLVLASFALEPSPLVSQLHT